MSPLDDSYDLSLAAAALRSNSADVRALLKALCGELSDTLGDRLRTQHAGGRRHKSEEISSVQINMANDQFEAIIDGADLRCTVGHVSGGIRIRSETIDIDQWITRLLQALKSEAEHSDAARQALENIVIGGQ
ncbi:MAG: hypothetical protein ACYDB2_08195 [Acidimicrobiales bacterium]